LATGAPGRESVIPAQAGIQRDAPRWLGIGIVLVIYLMLGVLYSVTTPLFEASDELWHYPFVKRLADGQGLPVQTLDQVGPWRQEGSQPPLYYALAGLLTRWVDTSDAEALRWLNPHADIGMLTRDRNVNMVIHTAREAWPYRGTSLAVHLVRWMSVLLGAVTVLAGYLLARELFPRDRMVALGAACLTAFNPMFLFVTASVNNDALVIALSAVCLWLMVRYLTRTPTPWQWALLGVLLGLASLSKASALGLVALAALTGVVVAWRERSWRRLVVAGVCIALPLALIGGWWYYRNWQLYRDPLGLTAFVAIVGPRHPVPTLRQLLGEWQGFVMAYWGFFGGVNVAAPGWVYWSLSILGLLGLPGLGVFVWRALRERAQAVGQWQQLGLVMLWPCVVFASLVRWTLMTIASQGRLMFSALTALCLLTATGLAALAPRRARWVWPALMSTVMLAAAIAMPLVTIRPAYARPALISEADIPATATRLDVTYGGVMRLLAYQSDRAQLAPGEQVAVTLYWQALAPMTLDYTVFVHLLAANDLIIGQRDMYPGQGTYPTTLWSPGETIADTYVVPISSAALTPAEAEFEVGLYDVKTGARLPVTDAAGQALGDNVRFGRVTLPQRVVDGIPNPMRLNLGDRIALVGYELDRTSAAPGEALHLTLYWQALRTIESNYSVFTHLLGPNAYIAAQMDGWPQQGASPTASWQKGQLVRDPYVLTVAADAPAGVYELEVGLYDADGRLSLLGKGGFVQDNRILLGRVRVAPPGDE
jgi:4-amino-4-deoxy-L-arabinose transferase-like glycosyltransferase